MKLKPLVYCLSILPLISIAQPKIHTITAPQCLLNQVKTSYQVLAKEKDIALVQLDDKGIDALIDAKANHQLSCGGFIDVSKKYNGSSFSDSHFLKNYLPKLSENKTLGYEIQHSKEVNEMLAQINPQMMWDNLITLTHFKDRYANSNNGVLAANWFKDKVEEIANQYQRKDISYEFIKTPGYKQPSVVVKIGKNEGPAIVIGAHMDTLSSRMSDKPGADDDGSGAVTVLEIARNLLSSGIEFVNPIYLMWYAAEEEGLFGSQEVVSYFKDNNIPVKSVLHFDMTGYANHNDETIYLMKDNVNAELTNFLSRLITSYVNKPIDYTTCGYGCSDHASWTYEGYPAAMPFEAAFGSDNPYIHTSKDTPEKLSLSHMTNFLKLGLAFAVELAEPKNI